MRDLSQVRDGWPAAAAEETRLLRQMTPAESLRQYLALQREFEPWLQETEPFFRRPRIEAMIQLQERLRKLNDVRQLTMQELFSSLARLQGQLEAAGIPSVVIGGLAVGFWGEPRLTRDVDVKVLIGREDRAQLLAALVSYTSLHADADAALRQHGIAFFQNSQGIRIDVMLADTSFDEAAIGRATMVEARPGQQVRVCTAEDLIVYKMVSLRARDRADVEGIIQRQWDALDDGYVEKWLREFEIALDDSTLVSEYRRLRRMR